MTGKAVPVMSWMCPLVQIDGWLKQVPRGKLPGETIYEAGEPVTPHRWIEVL